MTIADVIREHDALVREWGDARDVEEARLRLERPAPPSPGEPPWTGNMQKPVDDAERAWHVVFHAYHRHINDVLGAAEAVPHVAVLQARIDELAARVWTMIDAQPPGRLGPVPGLARCPACGSRCETVPPTAARSEMLGVCEADDAHVVEWLPWGG